MDLRLKKKKGIRDAPQTAEHSETETEKDNHLVSSEAQNPEVNEATEEADEDGSPGDLEGYGEHPAIFITQS